MREKHSLSIAGMCIALGVIACSGGANGIDATAQALDARIQQTRTVSALSDVDAGSALQTAQVEATAAAQALNATSTALSAKSDLEVQATAAAIAPIQAELPTYGVDPAEGEPGWIHPPITLTAEGFSEFDYRNNFLGTLTEDFVVSADITWNTTTGLAGCGFVVRSDGRDESINQYMALITRGGGGSIGFLRQQEGQFVNPQIQFAGAADPTFTSQNDTTNKLTIVARGDSISFYTNGSFVREFPATEYDLGFVAMVALSESGLTTCQFANAWLWILD